MPVHRYELAAGLSDGELADPGMAKPQSSWEAFMARRAKMQVAFLSPLLCCSACLLGDACSTLARTLGSVLNMQGEYDFILECLA